MKTNAYFDQVAFQGRFRDFQRQLFHKADDLLERSRINIIAAPGSGKKLIGLELIRRIGQPCIIVTSSDSLCERWGSTFRTQFFPEGQQAKADSLLSTHLLTPSVVNILTYNTLAAAIERKTATVDGQTLDFSETDMIRLIQDNSIRTVCLDEPHHLSDNHIKALESLLGVLGGEVQVLSLSSVPPYDLNSRDWNRFIGICGEINEEIFIPELVKAGSLCPHQDYVYFNYPSEEESAGIYGYRLRADEAVAEAMKLGFMSELNRRILKLYHKNLDFLYSHYDEMLAIIMLLNEYGYPVHRKICRMMTRSTELPPSTLQTAQTAFNFLLESQTLLRDFEKEELTTIFTDKRVLEHHHVSLAMTHKIRRTLVSSVGKLTSVAAITEAEDRQLGANLRELVVTDEVESDDIAAVGADEKPAVISPFTAFETIRSRCTWIPVGCLSKPALILPITAHQQLTEVYGVPSAAVTMTPLRHLTYAQFTINVSTDERRRLVLRLLADGIIRILVSTEEALGEDSKILCVNTLIPVCSASPFVTVPRMRGNVIHADKSFPDKTVHIWHIATVENEYSLTDHPALRLASRLSTGSTTIQSLDYAALCRRFDCFIGPDETSGELESSIDRISCIHPPYNSEGFKAINETMIAASDSRSKLKSVWQGAMVENTRPVAEVIVPKRAKVPVFTISNILLILLVIGALIFSSIYAYVAVALLIITFAEPDLFFYSVMLAVVVLLAILWAVYTILYLLPWFISHLFPRVSIYSLCAALLRALKEQGEIGKEARFVMEQTSDKKGYRIYLDYCSAREQTSYQVAVTEMLSPIKKPRYIIVRSGMIHSLRWKWSFACPEVIAQNDVSVKIFEKHLRMCMGLMKFQYTYRDPGRKYLIIARNKSYLNQRDCQVEKRLHVLKHDRF